MPNTLGDRLATLDQQRFTGRRAELAILDRLLDDASSGRVVLLHGPGGIGKSALLRELVRRASGRGLVARVVDGREIMPAPGEIERALEGVHAPARPLVIFDSYERMAGADGWLRSTLLPSLPEQSVVVLAGRAPPADAWFRDGWEHVVVDLALAPLGADDARDLLAAYGLRDAAQVEELVAWAAGWPLALSLAAGAGRPGPVPVAIPEGDLLRTLVARVTQAEVAEGDAGALAVAALARTCDAALVRSVLPGVDPEATMAWLRRLTFAERVGSGVTLHDLVRRAIRAELEASDPGRARELRRRIADHFHARAVAGEPRRLIDLTELIDDRALRWGFGNEGSAEYRVDAVRPGDLEALARWYAGRPRWWRDVETFVTGAPERVVVARDSRDRLAGVSIAVTAHDAPSVVDQDAFLGAWVAHARRVTPGADVLLWRDATDLGRNADPASPVVSLMNTAAILHSGLANVRYSYIPLDPVNEAAVHFSRSVGGRAVPELSVELDGRPLECHVIDHGDGGMLGQLREIVYAELRLPVAAHGGASAVRAEDVRDALRNLDRPAVLARSPLANGATAEERAASVRALVEDAARQAFGRSPEELLLRAVIERGYLDPASKHEQAAARLNISRTAYFRRLRTASDRVAQWLASSESL